jgi:thioredoxin 1
MGNLSPVTEADYEAVVLKSDVPVVVDFWATWCGPCKAMAPHLEQLQEDHAGKVKIVKLNIQEHPKQAQAVGVRSVPMIYVYKNGEIVDQLASNPGARKLRQFVERHL